MAPRQSRKTKPKTETTRKQARDAAMDLVRAWGRQGGKTRARNLSPERKREIARRASEARWAKAKEKKG